MHAWLFALFPTLWDGMDCSPPASSVHGILQERILEWVTMPSSRGSSPPRDWTPVSYLLLHWQAGSLPLAPAEKPKSTILQFKKCFVIAKTGFFFFFLSFFFCFCKNRFWQMKICLRQERVWSSEDLGRGLLGGSDMPEQGGAIGGCTCLSEKLAEQIVWEQVWD